ncbi:hypothetical protein [Prosthecodimorpha staleyi]|uniref:DUF2125 domain-containing protein n=1 Tax=Prosthecodimorpha staleyi TaxID=2840188 RepID=A0A947D8Z7_9HYPH|nr:hypothetical protein [Prosthecodimorpha staleyi]MBT9292583.1 hypothetical protein [Prosthecodimorpha staleyi]
MPRMPSCRTLAVVPLVAGLILAAPPLAGRARAETATAEEAARLTALANQAMPPPAPGEAPDTTIEPAGDHYRVTVRTQRLLKPLEILGLKPDLGTMTWKQVRQADGTWRAYDVERPPATVSAFGISSQTRLEGAVDGMRFTADMQRMIHSTFTATRATVAQKRSLVESTETSRDIRFEQTSDVAADGSLTYRFSSDRSDIEGKAAVTPGAAPSTDAVDYRADRELTDVTVEGLASGPLLALWSYLVAHPTRADLAAPDSALLDRLEAALPVFRRMSVVSSMDGFELKAPDLTIGAETGTVRVAATGPVAGAEAEFGLDLSGLTVKGPIPLAGLIPQSLSLGLKVAGLDLDFAARYAIQSLDVANDPPLGPDALAAIRASLAEANVTITLPPGHVRGPGYDVAWEGTLTVEHGVPVGKATVTAEGLDRILAGLSAPGAPPGTAMVLTGLYAAQALADKDPDGRSRWVIERKREHRILVNGRVPGFWRR